MCYLQSIRIFELKKIYDLFPSGGRILDIGGGKGWQAKFLSEKGFSVDAIDVSEEADRVWNVKIYDGDHIPHSDESFDVVFSSNTLEHIPKVEKFQKEILRVLKKEGVAIHILPTASWRINTFITHYIFVVREIFRSFRAQSGVSDSVVASARKKNSLFQLIVKTLFPSRHGEKGNSITEIWYFSRFWWLKMFRKNGWDVEVCKPLKLFYTGYVTFGSSLSMSKRIILHNIFGSSTRVYLLRKKSS